MLRLATVAAAALCTAGGSKVVVGIDPSKLLANLTHYLAVNIDSGSLFNNLNVSDTVLINLLSQLSQHNRSVILRIGGGAADSLLYTGVDGASGNGGNEPYSNTVLVNQTYWDQIVAFAGKSGAKIVWNLNGVQRDSNNAWDPTANATALFQHIVAASQQSHIQGWQLGNEPTLWSRRGIHVSGQQLGADYTKLKSVLKGYPSLPQTLYGPEGCCGDDSFLKDFLPVVHANNSLDYLSEHFYPIGPNPKACSVANYLNKTYYDSVLTLMAQYQGLIEQFAPGTPLVLGETATTNLGGCDTLSASFVSGFYWTYILGGAATRGIVQVNRQDLVGWSSQTERSQYMLTGVPGWSSEATDGPLKPHPDWFTTVLFQQLFSGKVLSTEWNGDNNAEFGLFAFCSAPGPLSPQGSVVMLYTNMAGEGVNVTFSNPSVQASTKTVWILTSTAAPGADATAHPPASLTGDAIYLNGQLMSVNSEGLLPQSPIPGAAVSPNGPLTLPPYSYGFIQAQAGFSVCY